MQTHGLVGRHRIFRHLFAFLGSSLCFYPDFTLMESFNHALKKNHQASFLILLFSWVRAVKAETPDMKRFHRPASLMIRQSRGHRNSFGTAAHIAYDF